MVLTEPRPRVAQAGLSATASYSAGVRARVESWIGGLASDDTHAALASYADLHHTVRELQSAGYESAAELVGAVEATLVSCLGSHVEEVREAAVVDLNVLYDGHALQAEEALHVAVLCCGEEEAGVSVSVPLQGGERLMAFDVGVLEAGSVVLRMFGPDVEGKGKRAPGWREFGMAYNAGKCAVECVLPAFEMPGYYDWLVAAPGGVEPVAADVLPVDTPRRLRGRFIVQPAGARETVLMEVPVDEVGAVWDEQTGRLRTRGSFDAVRAMLPTLKKDDGANAVYLMGALERPMDDVDSSPFSVVDRGSPASLLGGGASFSQLVEDMTALGIKPIVDAFDRVSRTRMHRKYRALTVETLNERGIPLRHPGTDGRENQWEDTALLNYRRIETWNLMVQEVKNLAAQYGVRGVRLDNAQSLPPILAPNTDELFRLDPDGKPHYSLSEIFYGAVVKANEEFGFWTSDAGLERGYPNPFLVKLCKEMWNEYPDFLIIAESNFHREPPLLTSGAIVHSIRIPQILASISGRSLRRDGSVARIPGSKRSNARTFARLFKNDRMELPKGSITVGCTCSHLSPFPSVLYGRRAWLAVDLLYFLPQLPMKLLGESAGRAYRMNATNTVGAHEEESEYDVNFDAVLPKSPKRTGQSSPAEGALPASMSLGALSSAATTGSNGPASPLPGAFGGNGGALSSSPLSGAIPAGLATDGISPLSGLGSVFGNATKLSKGSLSSGTTPLGGLAATGSAGTFVTGGPGLIRQTQQQQQLSTNSATSVESGVPLRKTSGSGLPPVADKKPKIKRRGSLADLRRTPSQSNMVRSRSRDDMRTGSVGSLSIDEYRRMSAIEEQVRQEIDPGSGMDISQIKGHYAHRQLVRQQIEALRVGTMCPLRADAHLAEQVFAFARYTENDIVVVAVNFADAREAPHHEHGCDVELDLRQLWDHLPDSYTRGDRINQFYTFVDGLERTERPGDLCTLEELVFRRYHTHLAPLGIQLYQLAKLETTEERKREHFEQCIQRLAGSEASDLKDPRENYAVATLARGASVSVAAFAEALGAIRTGLRNEGCDDDSVLRILQVCIQRASQLLFMVTYEGVQAPKDFEPPVAERIVAYLTHLSTAARDEDFMIMARSLVSRTTKLGPLVFLTAELGRFSTAGGLGVMVDELTQGLAALGLDVYVISPYYTVNRKNQTGYLGEGINWTQNVKVNLGTHEVECGIFEGKENGVNLIFLERGDYFPKVYADPGGAERHMQTVVLMSLGSLEICCQKGLVPGLVVSNDWLPSMVSGYRNFFGDYFDNTSFYHLIHNLGDGSYEGRCYPSPKEGGLEYVHRLGRHLVVNDSWEQKVCNPSRTALMTTDSWGTVSPSYLKELVSGHALADLLQMAKSPFGYPNGIRQKEREAALHRHSSSHEEAKEALQKKYFGFEKGDPSIPLFAFVGRITSQKGVHLILNAVDELIGHTGGKIQILIGGPANYSDQYSANCARHMHDLRNRHPWCFWAGPDEFFTDGPLVNMGADCGLMPSAFEPGGIVQQEFFVAGTPVVAFRTGGLKDTVHEWSRDEIEGNGFTFEGYNHGDFVWAVKRALRVFSHPEEYAQLRQSAYETTIDVSQVAWAWSSEFHRLRNACFTRSNVVSRAINASCEEEADAFNPSSKLVTLQWTGAGENVVLKGSFDGWTAEWNLEFPDAENEANGFVDVGEDGAKKSSSGPRALTLRLHPGKYDYKFRVDGEWVLAEDQMKQHNEAGIENNCISVE